MLMISYSKARVDSTTCIVRGRHEWQILYAIDAVTGGAWPRDIVWKRGPP